MTDRRSMICEELETRLADWMEHDLGDADRVALENHVASCARCTALVRDLTAIRQQAAAMPGLAPSRDLWPEIEARIQAPVIALDTASRSEPRRSRSTWWMGVAAAGLVAVTAGITYVATSNGMRDTEPAVASRDSSPVAPVASASLPPDTGMDVATAPEATLARETGPGGARRPRTAAGTREAAVTDPTLGTPYARDIAQLRSLVQQRRGELDSSTVAVLEKNLELIDRAIAESRAALERDPGSEFLADELARAMTKKVAVLRTVALLPARS